jgi:hypothetical protein
VEEVVAVAVTLDNGERRYFMTWGRVQDPVDPGPLEDLVLSQAGTYDLGGTPANASVCFTLREASGAPYFYEGLLDFARTTRTAAENYPAWRAAMAEAMRRGEHLYYLGRL